MKKKPIICNFVIPTHIYPRGVMFSFGQSNKELIKSMNRYKMTPITNIDLQDGDFGYFKDCSYNGLIRMPSIPFTPKEYSTLQHEICHFVFSILDYIGVQLEIHKSEEAYTYLIGYITEKVYDKINLLNK